jgi:hypothetical protein
LHRRAFPPTLEVLEGRSLLALIVDIDTGIPGTPPVNTSNYPANFSQAYAIKPGVQAPTYFHGGLMAQRFAVAEAASGRHDTLLELVTSGPANTVDPFALAGAMNWIAKSLVPQTRRQHPREPIVVACPISGSLHYYDAISIVQAEKQLGKVGVTIACAAGDLGQNNALNDAPWQFGSWPADGVVHGAGNVVAVAALDPSGHLQPWSNYGPSVRLAVPAQYGTSEAAILGAIALATTEEHLRTRPGESGMAYATKVALQTTRHQ